MSKRNHRKRRYKHTKRRKERGMTDDSLPELRASQRIMFAGTDQFNYTFKIITVHKPSLHPGFSTVIGHRAYNYGNLINVSVCVTWGRAIKMHDYWVELLVRGPLPDAIEEIGMGQWAAGSLFYPKARKYDKGG